MYKSRTFEIVKLLNYTDYSELRRYKYCFLTVSYWLNKFPFHSLVYNIKKLLNRKNYFFRR